MSLRHDFRAHAFPILIALAAAGCGPADDAGTDRIVVETRGDTTVVTSPAAAPRVDTVEAVETIWRSEELSNPTVLVKVDDLLVVGDRARLHLIGTDGAARTVGRDGEGPGEFGWIAQLAVRGDTIVVLDGRLHRHSLFDLDGTFVGDHVVTWPAAHVNPPRLGGAMALRADSVVRVADELVRLDRAQRAALLVQPLSGDEARIADEWDVTEWIEVGASGLSPPTLFGPRGHAALAADGRYALGDGLDYCVSVHTIDDPAILRICREWERLEVGPGTRGATGADLPDDLDPGQREMYEGFIEAPEIADLHPSYDGLVFGADGALWVRTTPPDTPDIHPMLRSYHPEAALTHRPWDRFDREGRLTRTVVLPTEFSPRVFESDGIWGFLTLEMGEIVVARTAFPD